MYEIKTRVQYLCDASPPGGNESDAIDARGLEDKRLVRGRGVQLHVHNVALWGSPERAPARRQLPD